MKKVLTVSNILSWINLVISSILLIFALLIFVSAPIFPVLISIVLIGCIALHSYASLQLRKSIVNPTLPLGPQTPVGIRLMGSMALIFAFMSFLSAVFLLTNINEVLKQYKFPADVNKANLKTGLIISGVFSLIFSLCVVMNVILNLRLLKWYIIEKDSNKVQ